MKSDHEPVEAFLKKVVLPEYESDGHARQLRAQILSRVKSGRAGRSTGRWWKTAALVLGLLGAAAVARETIIQVRHYYFYGRAKDGVNFFSAAPEKGDTNHSFMAAVGGDLDAAGIEQKRKDLEELDALRKRNARQLLRVFETEVNGKPLGRLFSYQYVLADGRTEILGEQGAEPLSPAQMEADRQQIAGLRKQAQREICKLIEVEVGGHRRRWVYCRYILSDRRGHTESEPDPELPGPVPLSRAQSDELARLVYLEKKGKFLGSTQVKVLGRTFTLQKYSFTLSDGTVVTHSQGWPEGPKNDLMPADWNELGQLIAAHKGETLGTYDEDVNGKPFKFTRVKYVLSDGTEVIQSNGKPRGER